MEQKENRVVLRGTVAGEAVLSHQVHGIDFYRFPLAVPRLSGREDLLNILFPLSSPETALPQAGAFVEVTGSSASPRFCGAPPWVGISATCSWRSTAVTAGPTISPASPGAAWLCSAASFRQGMPSGWTDGCRAAPTSKPSGRPPRSAPHLKSPSPAWRFQRSCPRKPICGKPEAS